MLAVLQTQFMFLLRQHRMCVSVCVCDSRDWTFINSLQIKSEAAGASQIIGWESG